MKHSKWKGHDDPFSILSTEERLRQGLATRMRAASYTKGGMDWALLFARYDRDHSGGLDFKEFSTALQRDGSIGQSITLAEMQQIFDYIDLDRDGLIVLEELQTFLDSELRKHQDGSVKQQGAKSARIQKFLAESITLERVVMREKAGLNSQKVGTLSAGEIVAVTHVAGNRIHVRRLKWSLDLEQQDASTDGGWVSERAAGGSGRLLVEVTLAHFCTFGFNFVCLFRVFACAFDADLWCQKRLNRCCRETSGRARHSLRRRWWIVWSSSRRCGDSRAATRFQGCSGRSSARGAVDLRRQGSRRGRWKMGIQRRRRGSRRGRRRRVRGARSRWSLRTTGSEWEGKI